MEKKATYTSVWDGGNMVTSDCEVNTETKEVFNIETVNISGLEILEREFVTIDGIEYDVSDDPVCTEYWRE